MLTLTSRAALFLSAFAPLFAIWALRGWGTVVVYIFGGVTVIGLVGTIVVLKVIYSSEGATYAINTAELRNSDVAAYVVTYIVPFFVSSFISWSDWVAILLLIFIIFLLYVNSDLIGINPILALWGMNLFKATLSSGETVWMLSRFQLRKQSEVAAVRFIADVYVALRAA